MYVFVRMLYRLSHHHLKKQYRRVDDGTKVLSLHLVLLREGMECGNEKYVQIFQRM